MAKKVNTDLMVAFDLYWLRFKKPGGPWYETTDVLREYLVSKGHEVRYKKDDLIFNGFSMKSIENHENTP